MEDQCSSFNWEFSTQEDGMEDLRHSLLYTTLELETTIMSAKEEILRREYEMINLNDLLNKAMKEKNEFESKCQKLMLENLILQQQQQKLQQSQSQSQSESDSDNNNTIQSSKTDPLEQHTQAAWEIACEKPLPEKGKLLQAVMEAGPLLQNLLLAGPLPHWQHPPPLVDSIDIPPVVVSSCVDIRKRSHSMLSDIVSEHSHNKYQKLVR